VTNYLVSEVLNQQSTDLREFLLQISILNRFNADLSDAVFYHRNRKELQGFQVVCRIIYLDRSDL
jgi:ATP/maltotriose-dependent transcriptional regulator MalT